ncbi:hypothetical protein KAF25_003003 [Fusarium avenaceum]|uniref:Cystathionine beta-lyase n=1 Tax=Fusarium avenaceum TaxID=40199 RepID=A0A9P7H8L1_9HYPO|nr:hypothetical protein KAF25_003003 [Fusarium avenaceum]
MDPVEQRFRTNLAKALPNLSIATQAVHADDVLNNVDDVAPPIHVAATFRYPRAPDLMREHHERPSYPVLDVGEHCYSRQSTPGLSRLEAVLSSILGQPCIAYSSGLAAFHVLLIMLRPKKVSIGAGYHGCHGTLELYARASGNEILPLDCSVGRLGPGDLIHLETPVNPTAKAFDIQYYADRAHSRGAYLSVDSTFAPPPLQDAFIQGADIGMHSGTKYIGGHSDLLCGILAIKNGSPGNEWLQQLHRDRLYLGSIMAGFDSWLATRSIRTLEMRVLKQSQSAQTIVNTLRLGLMGTSPSDKEVQIIQKVVKEIHHASLQDEANMKGSWLRKQMPRGYGPVFSLTFHKVEYARNLPSKLTLFQHATSLGGVESLIEWRTMTDSTVTKDFLRISIGVEDPEDLLADLLRGLEAVMTEPI